MRSTQVILPPVTNRKRASNTSAPKTATKIDQAFIPVTPVPPKTPTMRPPTKAPSMPIKIVAKKPPGSSPGITSLASTPAMSPIMSQDIIPHFLAPLLQ